MKAFVKAKAWTPHTLKECTQWSSTRLKASNMPLQPYELVQVSNNSIITNRVVASLNNKLDEKEM